MPVVSLLPDQGEYTKVAITDGTIGARAEKDTPVLETVEEVKADTGEYTLRLEDASYNDISYGNDYYILYWQNQSIIVHLLRDSIVSKTIEKTYEYEGHPTIREEVYVSTFPIGETVLKPPPKEVLDDLSTSTESVDTSFYIDMHGDHENGSFHSAPDKKGIGEIVAVIVFFISFFLIRFVTVRFGWVPPIIMTKRTLARQQRKNHSDINKF